MLLSNDILNELKSRYGEPQRFYHTWDHVTDMIRRAAEIDARLKDRDAFSIAIYFHDAVYDPKASDNEEASAALMRERLAGVAAPSTLAAAEALILATKTHVPDAHPDAAYLIDIDLAVLGAAPAVFDAYDTAIRKEYAHVPDDGYRAGRTRVLQSFLGRARIYVTDEFAALEPRARDNLARALVRLA